MENKVKKVKLENVKNLTTKKLIEEFIRKGGRIQKIKPMKKENKAEVKQL